MSPPTRGTVAIEMRNHLRSTTVEKGMMLQTNASPDSRAVNSIVKGPRDVLKRDSNVSAGRQSIRHTQQLMKFEQSPASSIGEEVSSMSVDGQNKNPFAPGQKDKVAGGTGIQEEVAL